MFATVARRYDLANHLLSAGLDHRWRAQAARACDAAEGRTVLDLCTGTGDVALALLRRPTRPARVIACDFSRPMLLRAQRKLARAKVARHVTLVEADAMRLPLADGSVDTAVSAFGLRNLADPARGLAEWVRVVRPGGRIVILEFYLPCRNGTAARAGPCWTDASRRRMADAFRLYFHHILPRLGQRLAGDDRGGYRYLAESVEAFGSAQKTAEAMRAVGIQKVRRERLPGGIATIFARCKAS